MTANLPRQPHQAGTRTLPTSPSHAPDHPAGTRPGAAVRYRPRHLRRRGRAIVVAFTAVTVFAACVAAANWLTSRYGFVPVGLGLSATAGTYAAGLCLLARDWLHDTAGRVAMLAAIAAGGAASAVMAGPRLALASAAAFVLSELADQPLRRRGWIRAVVASNAVGAPVDTVLFLGRPDSRFGRRCPASSWPRPPPLPCPCWSCWAPVRYYATASSPKVREAMRCGQLGQIITPASGNRVIPGVDWCADNSAYTGVLWNQLCQVCKSRSSTRSTVAA